LAAAASAAYLAALASADRSFDPAAYGPHLSFDSRAMVMGATNTGKDFWVLVQLERAKRVVCYDLGRDPKWLAVGYRPTTVGQLKADPIATGELLRSPTLHLVVYPCSQDFRADEAKPKPEQEQAKELAELAELCRTAENLVLVVGECGLLPQTCDAVLERIAMADRHHGVALVAISQRAVGIPLGVRTQASQLVTFLQTWKTDVDVLADQMSDGDKDRAEEVAEAIRSWKPKDPPIIWRPRSREGKRG
jgi:hypothetical protein